MHTPASWYKPLRARRAARLSALASLDRALLDPPSLCCDDDELCLACRTESLAC